MKPPQVSSRHIVTAAHCLWTPGGVASYGRAPAVVIGALRLEDVSMTQLYAAESFGIHPKYDGTFGRSSDSAIIKLARDVDITGSDGIRPACLPAEPLTPSARTAAQCWIAGYGNNNGHAMTGVGTLRYTVMQIMSDAACAHYTKSLQALLMHHDFDRKKSVCIIRVILGVSASRGLQVWARSRIAKNKINN